MPASPARKARTRVEILEHAARLFRLRGHAGTNIDDIMLAAGLTRGAFYAHFTSKDELFAETIRAGNGFVNRLRAGAVETVLDEYLDKNSLAANALACALAALPGDIARGPLAAQLEYANQLHAAIGELARGRRRKLDADATAAAVLAIGRRDRSPPAAARRARRPPPRSRGRRGGDRRGRRRARRARGAGCRLRRPRSSGRPNMMF